MSESINSGTHGSSGDSGTIELVHLGGERSKVEITGVGPYWLWIRFPFCNGEYKLDLHKNVVVFARRSATWKAVDVRAAWEIWNDRKGLKGVFRRYA